MIKNIKWTEIIQDESQATRKSALYILPTGAYTCKLIYIDDVGDKRYISSLGSDGNFVHVQSEPLITWTIVHPLGKKVSISIEDTAGSEIVGKVILNDGLVVIIEFNVPISGSAILN
jgi:hypothetical protein